MTQEELNRYHSRDIFLYDVINILNEHWGESRVDAQIEGECSPSATITIHYPDVRVTNEYDKFIDIQDLYVRFKVRYDGTFVSNDCVLTMMRSTFTVEQFLSGYSHSHLMRNRIGEWSYPCLGSGPIRNTIFCLYRRFDDMLWELFCNELDTWTRVESISGGPYFRMESIGADATNEVRISLSNTEPYSFKIGGRRVTVTSKQIIEKLLDTPLLKFGYDSSYYIGMSHLKFVLLVSKVTKELLRENLSDSDFNSIIESNFSNYILSNNKLYRPSSISTNILRNQLSLFTFKGTPIYLRIIGSDVDNIARNSVQVLNIRKISGLYIQIINILNSLYGRSTTERKTAIL